MKIEFGLMSTISLICLLMFGFVGDIEMLSIDVGFSLTETSFSAAINPTWAVWVPKEYLPNGNAFAYGNVIVIGDWSRGNMYGDYLLAHESIHIEQFRALGLLAWPAQFFLDVEPPKHIVTDWNDPTQPSLTMWAPPDWWPLRWSFVTIINSSCTILYSECSHCALISSIHQAHSCLSR